MTIYLKGKGYAKGSEFGNPTVIGDGPNQIEDALKNIERLLKFGAEPNGLNSIHTLNISYDPEQLNPRPEFYKKRQKKKEEDI